MHKLLIPVAVAASLGAASPATWSGQTPLVLDDDVKVPVELGVMSKCPDALACENIFDQVIPKVGTKMELDLLYIGKLDASDVEFGVKCMHGPEECAGNVQQLCVKKYAPDQWWSFVHCQNYQGRSKIGQPDIALKCAKIAKIDWEESGVGKCAGLDGSGKGQEGVLMLQESVKVAETLDIQKSCTVRINGESVCIRDGTWKECENGHTVNDFVRQINSAYDRLNRLV
ncbi:hypothetical protein BD626DRAFT_554667 [Schizophyllum amplum]|uniref:Gamma interferon inducible lysosomal thiol reductase-domain-containing protein n=1 Tax=Schizophyllum amplum TaxID=97359 RepID=A0A550CRZ6_9AGAR|nr:hypothetical protein BD626DRAFT_554667 [Auriculariopsis ampla]